MGSAPVAWDGVLTRTATSHPQDAGGWLSCALLSGPPLTVVGTYVPALTCRGGTPSPGFGLGKAVCCLGLTLRIVCPGDASQELSLS